MVARSEMVYLHGLACTYLHKTRMSVDPNPTKRKETISIFVMIHSKISERFGVDIGGQRIRMDRWE